MKKIFIYLFLISIILNACSDCPVSDNPPTLSCETRVVTLEKFNPNFTISNNQTILDADYNISTYLFPDNSSSSGSFPNDSRFKDKNLIPLVSFPFLYEGSIFLASIADAYPSNEQLVGDFLIQDVNVNSNPRTANIRLYGSISLFDQGLFTENSQQFCNYVEQNEDDILNSFSSFTSSNRFGRNQAGAIINNYATNSVVISDNEGKFIGILGDPNVPTPPPDILSKLNNAIPNIVSVDLQVAPGNVYTYIARNGKRFVFVITEIRQSDISPNRKRVSMMLYSLD